MTIAEKREYVDGFCNDQADCIGCIFDKPGMWCQIVNHDVGQMNEHELDEAIKLIMSSHDDNDTDDEHRCDECAYFECGENEAPCINCKNGICANDPRYATAQMLWSKTKEAVNHPSHYNQGGIECIDAMVAAYGKEAVENFCLCNAFKYVWRNRDKNGFEDIDKAIWYLNKIKELCSDE